MFVKYEDFASSPIDTLRRIVQWCDVPYTEDQLLDAAANVHSQSIDRWKNELPPEYLEQTMPILQPMLQRLGYAVDQ